MKAEAAISVELVVAIEIVRAVVGGQQQVEIAVTVKIAVGQSPSDLGLTEATANFVGHIVEFPLPVVEEQLRRLGVADAANIAHRVVDVTIHDCQVKPAIEVSVQK